MAYTYGTNGISPDHSYSVSYFDEDKIRNDVDKAKKQSDVIIVSAHWGDENAFVPNDFQTRYAKLFADLGVDVVIGTHSHTIQPIEWIEEKKGHKMLCVYSLGNFVSDMAGIDNMIGGEIKFDFVKKNERVDIENVCFEPTIPHAQRGANGYQQGFVVYRYDQYSDALASLHGLNGFYGEYMSMDHIKMRVKQVIDARFLGKEFQ